MSTVAKAPREQSQTTFSACLHFILTIIGAKYAPVPFNESCRDFVLRAPPARSRFSLGFWAQNGNTAQRRREFAFRRG
jgi:hypothetical protein